MSSQLPRRLVAAAIFLVFFLMAGVVATQVFAGFADFHPLLGSPFVTVGGRAFYSPLCLSSWVLELGDYFPSASEGAREVLIWGGVVSCLLSLVVSLTGEKRADAHSTLHGSAHWAKKDEIVKAGLCQKAGVFLSHDGHEYLRHDGPEHYAVIAPTRTGKGAGIVIPTLLAWSESALVLDIKEENWSVTAGKRAQMGPVLYFNPSSFESVHYNPLWEIRRDHHEVEDVQGLVNIIVDPDGKGFSGDHWRLTGHELLVATILHLLYAGDEEQKSLNGVVRFLSSKDKTFVETLNEMLTYPHVPGPDGEMRPHINIAEPARAMLNKAENERSGVLSTAMSFLNLYRDPIIARNTSDSDFKIDDLVCHTKPITLYLVVSPKQIDRLKPLLRLILNQICHRLTESVNAPRERRLLLVLDEFPKLGKLAVFERALGYMAGFGLKAMLIGQSMQELKAIYGERTSLLDNTHIRVFYTPNTIETAKYISESLGNRTISYENESRSLRRGSLWHQSKNFSEHFISRALLTPDEVMTLASTDSIIFVGSCAPIRAKKITYFNDPTFKSDVLSPPILYQKGRKVYEHDIPKPVPSWEENKFTSHMSTKEALEPHLIIENITSLMSESDEIDERVYFEQSSTSEPNTGVVTNSSGVVDAGLIESIATDEKIKLYDDIYEVSAEDLTSAWSSILNRKQG